MNAPTHPRIPRVLSIAGTDPTGGAGIQADLKSIAANGGYGMAVVTALVAQNSRGVRAIHTPPPEFLSEQLRSVSDDVTIDAVKIGMLAQAEFIDVVELWLGETAPPVVVLDPVMISTSGRRLLDPEAEPSLARLLGRVDLVTPNLHELGALLGEPPATQWSPALRLAERLSEIHGVTVLLKGGHLGGPGSPDALVDSMGRLPGGRHVFQSDATRVNTTNTHGTGCSLSSAMATIQVRSGDWAASLTEAKEWLQDSLRHADELDVGSGDGPIHHFHRLWDADSRTPRQSS